jgi:nucleoside phosphorylase
MASSGDIKQQRDLLDIHRGNLKHYMRQAAAHGGEAFSPPMTINGLAEARREIARIKAVLRGWGEMAADEPGDLSAEGSSASPEQPPVPPALQADVLIVTVTEVEARAVLDQSQAASGQEAQVHFIGDNNIYHELGLIGGARTFMVQSEMGSGGTGGSILTVKESIEVLKPKALVMVGIAFGMDESKQQIGDILVAKQLLLYDLQRAGSDGSGGLKISLRGDQPSASIRLLNRFRASVYRWKNAKPDFGLVLSGDKLIDNLDYRDQLRHTAPEAIGGEMEGAGLYAVAQRCKVDWILVKAICDWADGQKGVDKQNRQQLAAANAAAFVLHTIQQGGFVGP